ncbi:MAG: hypothetical protein JSS65_01785 [Armatimonadetes bacterium]|nr:hypothetical protein [Armatimonadota bacterium]
MFAPLLVLAPALLPQAQAKTLSTSLAQDTTLDRSKAEADFGRDTVLRGGSGLAILVRFPQLRAPEGKNMRVTSAKLVLTSVTKDVPKLESVGRLTKAWDEGPDDGPVLAADKRQRPPSAFAATWNSAQHGFAKWTSPGAAEDVVNIPATGSVNGETYVVDGLAEAAQWICDHPGQNYGFRLAFANQVTFLSHDFFEGRPKLEVEFAERGGDGPDLAVVSVEKEGAGWSASVANLGTSSAPAGKVEWKAGADSGSADRPVLAAGERATVALGPGPKPFPADQRLSRMLVSATCAGDTDLGNNEASVWTDGEPLACVGGDAAQTVQAQSLVSAMNEYLLPMSRYSFARDGGRVRFRLVTKAEGGAPVVKLSATTNIRMLWKAYLDSKFGSVFGEMGPGATPRITRDYRDDTRWLNLLPLPALGFPGSVENPVALQTSLGFSAPEIYLANASLGSTPEQCAALVQQVPNVLLVQIKDYTGQPVAACDVDYVPAKSGVPDESAAMHYRTDANGLFRVSGRDAGNGKKNAFGPVTPENLYVQIRTKRGKTVESFWMPVWSLWQEVARGNKSVGTLEYRVNQSSGEIDTRLDLALNKIVTDSAGSPPAQLVAMVDGKPETAFDFDTSAKPGWIEVDLGRDRPIGELRLSVPAGSKIWEMFDVAVYGTAQTPASARTWLRETMSTQHAALVSVEKSGTLTYTYRAPAIAGRYLRIIPRDGKKVSLRAVEVYPAILGG